MRYGALHSLVTGVSGGDDEQRVDIPEEESTRTETIRFLVW